MARAWPRKPARSGWPAPRVTHRCRLPMASTWSNRCWPGRDRPPVPSSARSPREAGSEMTVRAEETTQVRTAAVVTAITRMREQLGEPHELRDIARTAYMSKFYFHRVFRNVTASTPGRFLTALRIAEARQLLLETPMSATDISITVGYSSFGTFTSQFTKLVGLSP